MPDPQSLMPQLAELPRAEAKPRVAAVLHGSSQGDPAGGVAGPRAADFAALLADRGAGESSDAAPKDVDPRTIKNTINQLVKETSKSDLSDLPAVAAVAAAVAALAPVAGARAGSAGPAAPDASGLEAVPAAREAARAAALAGLLVDGRARPASGLDGKNLPAAGNAVAAGHAPGQVVLSISPAARAGLAAAAVPSVAHSAGSGLAAGCQGEPTSQAASAGLDPRLPAENSPLGTDAESVTANGALGRTSARAVGDLAQWPSTGSGSSLEGHEQPRPASAAAAHAPLAIEVRSTAGSAGPDSTPLSGAAVDARIAIEAHRLAALPATRDRASGAAGAGSAAGGATGAPSAPASMEIAAARDSIGLTRDRLGPPPRGSAAPVGVAGASTRAPVGVWPLESSAPVGGDAAGSVSAGAPPGMPGAHAVPRGMRLGLDGLPAPGTASAGGPLALRLAGGGRDDDPGPGRLDAVAGLGRTPADSGSSTAAVGAAGPTHAFSAALPASGSSPGATATVAGAAVPAHDPGSLSTALADRLVMVAQHGGHSARVRLEPEELGTLDIRLSVHDDRVSVAISTQHAHARELIEATLPRLREMLQHQGMSLLDVDVSDSQSHAERGAPPVPAPGPEHHEAAAMPVPQIAASQAAQRRETRLLDVLA